MNGFEQIKSFYSWVFNNPDKVKLCLSMIKCQQMNGTIGIKTLETDIANNVRLKKKICIISFVVIHPNENILSGTGLPSNGVK